MNFWSKSRFELHQMSLAAFIIQIYMTKNDHFYSHIHKNSTHWIQHSVLSKHCGEVRGRDFCSPFACTAVNGDPLRTVRRLPSNQLIPWLCITRMAPYKVASSAGISPEESGGGKKFGETLSQKIFFQNPFVG
jgi:hypothetical protein